MVKQVKLQISEPCHENWNDMSPVEKGRFCSSCQKQVVDFTLMSDGELRNYFLDRQNQSVCGRFNDHQINRNILIPGKTIPWVKYFFQIAIPAFLFTAKATAQGQVKTVANVVVPEKNPIDSSKNRIEEEVLMGIIAIQNSITISGKIYDPAGNPLPSARVMIKGTNRIISADANGEYKFVLANNDKKVLVVQSIGFETHELTIDPARQNQYDIVLNTQLDNLILGEVVVVRKNKPPKKEKKIPLISSIVDTVKHLFSVYPNPVMSGSAINIQWKGTEEGYYQLNLVSQSGMIAYQKEIWIDADARLLNFDLPKVSAGTYMISFANKKTGKIIAERVVIN